MSEEWDELSEGWEWKSLPEVAEIVMGQSPPGSTYNTDRNGLPFYQGKTDFGELHPTPRVWCTQPTKIARPDDILMSVRAPVGPTNIANSECAIGRGLCIIRPRDGMPSRYLREYFKFIEDEIADMGKGSTFTSISRADLETIKVPIAPLPEQHRIVGKIERLFAESRTAREALDKVPALLKRFRQSVLAKAFRGELTERDSNDEPASALLERIREERRRKWEEARGSSAIRGSSAVVLRTTGGAGGSSTAAQTGRNKKAKYVEPELPDTSTLPEGWQWVTAGQTADVVGGIQKTPARTPKKNAYPYLRVANVHRGKLDLTEMHKFELQGGDLDKWRLQRGDVLIVEGNGSITEIGRCALWNGEIKDCVHQNHIIRVRFESGIDPTYFHYFLNSNEGSNSITAVASSTSGLYTLSVSKVQNIIFPVAPLAEQSLIVAKIESLLAQAEAIERAVDAAQRRAERVDQAVLARAFRGEF